MFLNKTSLTLDKQQHYTNTHTRIHTLPLRDRKIVLESVVEVNDFSELWPEEADSATQVPLIILLTGSVRTHRPDNSDKKF